MRSEYRLCGVCYRRVNEAGGGLNVTLVVGRPVIPARELERSPLPAGEVIEHFIERPQKGHDVSSGIQEIS